MTLLNPDGKNDYEWRRCIIIFPRMGKMLSRNGGVQTGLIWPGVYMVRKSRTLRRPIYRSANS